MAVYKNLLGHSLEKFGAVTVFDATFYDDKNKPLITFDTLTVSNISVEAEQKEIRGGQGANLLVTYDYGKNATVEITDALASMFSLQYLMGTKINTTFQAMVRREAVLDNGNWYVHDKPHTDLNASALIYLKDNKTQEMIEEGIDIIEEIGKGYKVTITGSTDLANAEKVFVYYNATFATESTAGPSHVRELKLTSTDFPSIVKMVGETIFVDAKTGRRVNAQIEIPKFKLNADFELTFEAEGDASSFDFSGVALANGKDLIIMRTLGYADEENSSANGGINTGKNPQ